jgi:hypothetical protein
MRRISLSFLLPLSLCILVSSARSQTTQSQQGTPSPASQTPDSKPAQPAQSPPKSATRPQKVWTNEDMGDLRDRSAISTVGNPHPAKPSVNEKTVPNATRRNAKWYRDQILKLRAKIPPLDANIQQLQAALSGKTVDSVRRYWGTRPDDWRDQLVRLQKQRDAIQAKIAALEDAARHDGVPQNALS